MIAGTAIDNDGSPQHLGTSDIWARRQAMVSGVINARRHRPNVAIN
jgi:hypothetical protein